MLSNFSKVTQLVGDNWNFKPMFICATYSLIFHTVLH